MLLRSDESTAMLVVVRGAAAAAGHLRAPRRPPHAGRARRGRPRATRGYSGMPAYLMGGSSGAWTDEQSATSSAAKRPCDSGPAPHNGQQWQQPTAAAGVCRWWG